MYNRPCIEILSGNLRQDLESLHRACYILHWALTEQCHCIYGHSQAWSYVVFIEVFCSVWIYFFLFPTCKCVLLPDLCLFVLLFFSKTVFCFSPKTTLTSYSFHSSLYIVRKCLFGFDKILVFLSARAFPVVQCAEKGNVFQWIQEACQLWKVVKLMNYIVTSVIFHPGG